MYCHPLFAQQYIRQREHELAAAAARYGPLKTGRQRVRRPLRYRAGWRLVEIGLKMAGTSALELP
jgi:hypothetical protein